MNILTIILSTIIKPAAYLDPGTGSLIIQGIIAALAGLAFVFRKYFGVFFGLFKKKTDDDLDSELENESFDTDEE